MRVLSISPYPFWDDEDRKGMPSIYLGQKSFVLAGHQVVYAFPGRDTRSYDYDGIGMHQFRLRFPIASSRRLTLHRLSLKVYYLVFLVVATMRGIALCRRFRPDVVYGHFFFGAPVAWVLGRLHGIPNVTRMYGTFLYRHVGTWWGRLRKLDEVLAFKTPCTYLVITNDGTMGGAVAEALRVPPERVKFWRNGVDREMYDPAYDAGPLKDSLGIPRRHKLVLALSRLVSWKRVDRLIAALPAVVAACPDTTAVIVGDGEDRAALERMCAALGVREHVRFVGQVLHAETPRYLNAADVFVSLYDVSNVGNPLLEALRCGRCIVSVDVGGTREVIPDDGVGILLGPDELDRLPAVLIDLLTDDEKRRRLQRAALARAEVVLQTWPERTRMEVRLIEDLVGGRREQPATPAASEEGRAA